MARYRIKNKSKCPGTVSESLRAERKRADKLEVMLYSFVYNRIAYPAGRFLGKSEDEILLKALEIVDAGEKSVDFGQARLRLERAHALMKKRGEENGK